MAKKSYNVMEKDAAGKYILKSLLIEWGMNWRNGVVYWDGKEIGRFSGRKELKNGLTYRLPSGAKMDVMLNDPFFSLTGAKMEVLYNEKPVPGSDTDPAKTLKTSYSALWFVGGLTFLAGISAELFAIEFLLQMGINMFSGMFGLVYVALGFFVKERSMTALMGAVGLYAIDSLAGVFLSFQDGGSYPFSGMFLKVFIFILIYKGIDALKQLKAEENQVTVDAPTSLTR